MDSKVGGLLTGLAQGITKGYLAKKQKLHNDELSKEESQFKMMQDALHTAQGRGDTNAIAHILRSMEEFTTKSSAGKEGRGKKGSEARGGILSKLADMISGGQQTSESKQATSNNEKLISEGKSQDAERPRLATTQPLLKSNQQMGEEENQQVLRHQQVLAPGIRAEKEAEQKDMEKRQLDVQELKDKDSKKKAEFIQEAIASRDVTKIAVALAARNGTTADEEMQKAGEFVTNLNQSKLETIKTKNQKIILDESRLDKRLNEDIKRWDIQAKQKNRALSQADKRIAQGDRRLSQGDRKLDQGDISLGQGQQRINQKPSEAQRLEELKIKENYINIRSELKKIATDARQQENIAANGLTAPKVKIEAEKKHEQLVKDYENKSQELEKARQEFNKIVPESEKQSEKVNTSPSKTLSKDNKKGERKFTVITQNGTDKKFKYYGRKADGSPDMEEIKQ